MKTGKHYFGLLTEEEQRNFRQACEETGSISFDYLMESKNDNFDGFISSAFRWKATKQGFEYWDKIASSNREEQPIEKPKTTNISYFEEPKPLEIFSFIFIYSVIVFLVMCLLMVIHTASYKQGYKSGYKHGIEKVDSIVNYEELTTESVEAVQSMQLNTMRYESK